PEDRRRRARCERGLVEAQDVVPRDAVDRRRLLGPAVGREVAVHEPAELARRELHRVVVAPPEHAHALPLRERDLVLAEHGMLHVLPLAVRELRHRALVRESERAGERARRAGDRDDPRRVHRTSPAPGALWGTARPTTRFFLVNVAFATRWMSSAVTASIFRS